MAMISSVLLVVSRYLPEDESAFNDPLEARKDALNVLNHPRHRRALILKELAKQHGIFFQVPSHPRSTLNLYRLVHCEALVKFFGESWNEWQVREEAVVEACIDDPRSSMSFPVPDDELKTPKAISDQVSLLCRDNFTAIFPELREELLWDAAVIVQAVDQLLEKQSTTVYALQTHPGHHAAYGKFGGVCYLNHAALSARLLQTKGEVSKVAILDLDYHCGDGTEDIFYQDSSVLVVSIHCDPHYDYPFYTGFEESTGDGEGEGFTLHLPLKPKSGYTEYCAAVEKALDKIQSFGAESLVVSLGLDTHDGDPCAGKRGGFKLSGGDYFQIGRAIGSQCNKLPTLVVQEGGYKMDDVPRALADFLRGHIEARQS